MNKAETSQLLTMAALVDNRPITDEAVLMWHGLLSDIEYWEALEAVKTYYRTATGWMMPAHVRNLVDAARLEEQRAVGRELVARRQKMLDDGIDWVPFEQGDPAAIEKYKRAQQQDAEGQP